MARSYPANGQNGDLVSAKAWQDDDEYAPLKAIRYEATENISEVVVPGF